jgi:ABC-type multidrug transport system ATPase subunit
VGYVQQQDIHLETTTVREALQFSAFLRQPASVPKEEKAKYVEDIITLLEMQPYADAIVGVPGEGLNVEQRKRLTIGVELAAKPDVLLFLDEPTSGLDSQTAWSISTLLRKLSDHGQAILCTIHQPSTILFQQFDRLLLLAKGGKTVYFGDIGKNSETLIDYFEQYGAEPCPGDENPADWMLRVIGAAPGSVATRDWGETWRSSSEFTQVRQEIEHLKRNKAPKAENNDHKQQYAALFRMQLWFCTKRVFEQYWRSPSYIYSKLSLCFGTASLIKIQFLVLC